MHDNRHLSLSHYANKWPSEYHSFSYEVICLNLYLIETPFNAFANRAGPDQAALVRAA